jgi:peroxiredoxin
MGTILRARRRCVFASIVPLLLIAGMGPVDAARPGTPTTQPTKATGTLQLDYDDFELIMLFRTRKVEVSSKNGRVVLPAGVYELLSWTLRARGSDGQVWQARGGMGMDEVVIRPGQVTRLTLASPIKACWKNASGSNPILMELRFTGTNGEECLGVGIPGKELPKPRFEVRDAAGAVVYAGEIRFCCKFRGAALWLRDGAEGTPAGAAGRFTAHVTAQWGPFPVAMERPLAFDVAAVTAPADAAAVGGEAPDFLLPPVDGGNKVQLSSLRDRPVALAFFCGCGPCSEVAQGLARLEGIHSVAVVSDGESFRGEALKRFRSLTGFRGPILFDRDRAAGRRYRSFECPRVWLVDRSGRLAHVNESPREEPAHLLSHLRAALEALPTDGHTASSSLQNPTFAR